MLRGVRLPIHDPHINHRLRRSRQDMEIILRKALRLAGSILYCLLLFNRSQRALSSSNRSPQTSNNRSRLATDSLNRLGLARSLNKMGSAIRISRPRLYPPYRSSPPSLRCNRKRLDLRLL